MNKLIDVIKIYDFTNKNFIDRELVLMKVKVNTKNRQDAINVVENIGGIIANVAPDALTVEVVGDQNKIKTLLELMKPYGIKEMIRTGKIAIAVEDKKHK